MQRLQSKAKLGRASVRNHFDMQGATEALARGCQLFGCPLTVKGLDARCDTLGQSHSRHLFL